MKILTISDEECPAFWDYYIPGRLDGYDLIIACGDLNAKYLSFLVTMARVPVLYVHGNHDVNYDQVPPEGCDCIDDHIVVYNGIRILGLGGCRRYHRGPHQYSEAEMRHRKVWEMRRTGPTGALQRCETCWISISHRFWSTAMYIRLTAIKFPGRSTITAAGLSMPASGMYLRFPTDPMNCGTTARSSTRPAENGKPLLKGWS